MAYRQQLKIGKKVEKEHSGTIDFIIKMLKRDKTPKKKEIYGKIAKDHLKEDPKYYTKLMKAGL